MSVRKYLPLSHYTRNQNIRFAIGKMEDDKKLDQLLNYKNPTTHCLMKNDGVQVDIYVDGMTREHVPLD